MTKRFTIHSIIVLLLALALGMGLLHGTQGAETSTASSIVSADYPWQTADGAYYEFAMTWVRTGAQQYYRLYGAWPSSWNDVEEAGLFNGVLLNLRNEPIDPDAVSLGYYGDVRYFPPTDGNAPKVLHAMYLNGLQNKFWEVPTPPTFAAEAQTVVQLLAEKGKTEQAQQMQLAIKDERVRTQHALEVMLHQGIELFALVYERYPDSLDELLASGVGPFSPDSINPLTGQLFKGDGSPWDFTYHNYPQGANGSGHPSFYLNHVDENGTDATVRLINRY